MADTDSADALPDPSDKSGEALRKKSKLNFRSWLWLQHHRNSEFSPLARFVLSGGPDGVFVNKPLKSSVVAFELAQMYATGQGRPALTSKMVHMANRSVVAYRDDDASVEDLMKQRENEDMAAEKFIYGIEREVLEGEGLVPVTYRGGTALHQTEGGLPRVICGYINMFGKGCARQAVPGVDRCDIHGGMYMDPEQIKEVLEAGQKKIIAASDLAIEAVLDLMQNSTQDPIRLKAAEMILDRAGFRPGMEITVKDGGSGGDGTKSPSELLTERLRRLAPNEGEILDTTGLMGPGTGQVINQDGEDVA
jgi:hypothetical protein